MSKFNNHPFNSYDFSNISTEQMLYTESDLENSMDRIETINFHEEKDVRGVRFWAYNAGHVLGAAMFMIEIAGVKVRQTTITTRLINFLHLPYLWALLLFATTPVPTWSSRVVLAGLILFLHFRKIKTNPVLGNSSIVQNRSWYCSFGLVFAFWQDQDQGRFRAALLKSNLKWLWNLRVGSRISHVTPAVFKLLVKIIRFLFALQVLYTGDFSRQEDRHLMAAEIPTVHPDVLITVSCCNFSIVLIQFYEEWICAVPTMLLEELHWTKLQKLWFIFL